MRISAKADYAVRAAVELAVAQLDPARDGRDEEPVKAEWIATAVRANLRGVVEHVTVADVAGWRLPKAIDKLAEDPEAWVTR